MKQEKLQQAIKLNDYINIIEHRIVAIDKDMQKPIGSTQYCGIDEEIQKIFEQSHLKGEQVKIKSLKLIKSQFEKQLEKL